MSRDRGRSATDFKGIGPQKVRENRRIRLDISVVVSLAMISVMGTLIWWSLLPGMATFVIKIESDTNWQATFGSREEGFRVINGYGSDSFTVLGTIAGAEVQKRSEEGYLRVILIRDGTVISVQETRMPYGVIIVDSRPDVLASLQCNGL